MSINILESVSATGHNLGAHATISECYPHHPNYGSYTKSRLDSQSELLTCYPNDATNKGGKVCSGLFEEGQERYAQQSCARMGKQPNSELETSLRIQLSHISPNSELLVRSDGAWQMRVVEAKEEEGLCTFAMWPFHAYFERRRRVVGASGCGPEERMKFLGELQKTVGAARGRQRRRSVKTLF